MKRIISILASLLLASGAVLASGDHKGHAGHGDKKAAAPSAAAMADGEVRKIDKERGRITLKHGEIKSLDMAPMTMVFRVKDPAMLDQVKEGDKIGFTAEKVGGQFTVMSIEARK
ncbi:MAG: copper-binding protein [Burkholderiales bacterium]